MLKFTIPLLYLLASCGASSVILTHPIPSGGSDLLAFPTDFQGSYIVSDTILHTDFFDASNERYSPEIDLPADTSIFITYRASVRCDERIMVQEIIYHGYMKDELYESLSQKDKDEMDTIVYHEGYVELIAPQEVDTLFDFERGDLLRKFSKEAYVVNVAMDTTFLPIFLEQEGGGGIRIFEFDRDAVMNYFAQSGKLSWESKRLLLEDGEPIQLSNKECKKIARKRLFKHRYLLRNGKELN